MKKPSFPMLLALIIPGICFLSLSIYKASHTPFTHDESFTYMTYVKKSVWGIISMESPASANNHILNSLSMKVIDKLLPATPFNLRLPNLFGHLIFIIFSSLLSLQFKRNFLKIAAFIFINCNIYLIDLFSLARGYGLSLCFLMMHWYFLNRVFANAKDKVSFRWMVIALLMSIASNFSIIYYSLALGLICLSIDLYKYQQSGILADSIVFSHWMFMTLCILTMFAFCYGPILKLIQYKQLYFGGTQNIFADTVYSLVYYSCISFKMDDYRLQLIYYAVLISFCLFLLILVQAVFKRRLFKETNFFMAALGFVLVIQVVFFYLFNTKFLIQRTAAFLIPLYMLSLLALINEADGSILGIITFLLSLVILPTSISSVPLNYSLNWSYDADNERLIHDLKQIQKNSPQEKKISLGIDWIFEPSLNFYRYTTNAGKCLDTVDRNGYLNRNFEYYFVESSSLNKFADTVRFKLLKTYDLSGNKLIKNKSFEQH
jgi:hypothetical protein